ncbi:hypothetical protein B0H14DRAFT_2705604 [Mycena olivaceomarginata]|nr:hypothetical protein B0H14DRAFT_2705604 [Mycena olivaceomarginata]
MSASDALSAVTTLHSIVKQTELLHLSNRIRHVVLSLEDSRRRDVIRDTDYNDALTVISDVILRTERLTQRLRLNEDVKNYLSVHTVEFSQSEQYSMLSASIEEITIKLAELDLRLRPRGGDSWAPSVNVRQLIKDAGYSRPGFLDGDSSYDASSPGGLQISRTEPLRWWYNKYAEYHGISGASTPGQTIAKLDLISGGIWAGRTHFQFHRTLRVPESSNQTPSQLPPDLGQYPLLPISNLEEARLPVSMRGKGGFIMPMFNKEALWISFGGSSGNAVKVSVGGINVVSGSFYKALTPLAIEQDYLVTGHQTRLDGIVAGPGVVRQFVASTVGNGYTVEEQVTGKADVGGLQCDIFQRRAFGGTFSLRSTFQDLDDLKTLQELDIPVQSQVLLSPNKRSVCLGKDWTLREYHRQSTSPSITLRAEYAQIQDFPGRSLISQFPRWSFDVPKPSQLGASAGGEIHQRIWRDETARNTRLYDEQHGHRLYIFHYVFFETKHITQWPCICPITREMYHRHNIPWFPSYQDQEAHVDTVSNLDEERTGIVLNQNNYSMGGKVAPLHSSLS